MTTISNGTRIREDHNTFANAVTSVSAGITVQGSEVWEAPADGAEVKKGDKWMLVSSVGGIRLSEPGWMAYIHKTYPICSNFKIIDGDPPPPPPPTEPIPFPDEFTLTNPDGRKGKYIFSKIIE